MTIKTDWTPSDYLDYENYNRILSNLKSVCIYPSPALDPKYTIDKFLTRRDWERVLTIAMETAAVWGIPNPGIDNNPDVITAGQINGIETITKQAAERQTHYIDNKKQTRYVGSGYCNTGIYAI